MGSDPNDTHSLTQSESKVACAKEAVSYKNAAPLKPKFNFKSSYGEPKILLPVMFALTERSIVQLDRINSLFPRSFCS